MPYRLELSPEASADVAEAFSWYEAHGTGHGAGFEAELNGTLDLIVAMPGAGRVVHRALRRALLQHYPFAVYYVLADDGIEIRGVLHTSRHPRSWRGRA